MKPCRACGCLITRRRLFHVIESDEPLEARLEPPEAARVLDTLSLARGKVPRDRPRPRVHKSPLFRFTLGDTGPVFRVRIHPPRSTP